MKKTKKTQLTIIDKTSKKLMLNLFKKEIKEMFYIDFYESQRRYSCSFGEISFSLGCILSCSNLHFQIETNYYSHLDRITLQQG